MGPEKITEALKWVYAQERFKRIQHSADEDSHFPTGVDRDAFVSFCTSVKLNSESSKLTLLN